VTYRFVVDNKTEIRDFLVTRRARITPEQAGLPDFGPRAVADDPDRAAYIPQPVSARAEFRP
jgi:hypothetical protein